MTVATSMTADPERLAFPRLLVRSAILGALVPVTQGDFWDVKAVQVVSALVLCVVLYGLEKAVLYPFRKRMTIKPLHLAAYRGAVLSGLLIFVFSGDWAAALGGAALYGPLFAMLFFWVESGVIRAVYRTPASPPLEGGPR